MQNSPLEVHLHNYIIQASMASYLLSYARDTKTFDINIYIFVVKYFLKLMDQSFSVLILDKQKNFT